MLARRPYSVAELRHALEKKFGDVSEVSQAVARLRELGYLDDKKFAEHAAATLAVNRTYGPLRVKRELKAKLVNYKFIDPAVARAYQEVSETDLLNRALERKLRSLRLPVTAPKVQSVIASLLRRGFRAGDIIKAVRSRPELRPASDDMNPVDLEEGIG